ncbi:transcription antitermination factor NusB [Agrococcus sp. Marseille-Q4369]|uniref:transcription antitermination factor NusB n=1 Tax=unclassified Agrococcus TaxID=2615065 RepID=UPI001B8B573E|nr:transcription antitermination factor NusB [Agrococcus sp. Marseille-Q4369]QUW19188.1 transcription antitermination factor NusB [Agrococcus sp. Marseille-Q4369]
MSGQETYPSRRKARKHAVEVLYSAQARDEAPETVLRDTAARLGWAKHPWFAFAREIVAGVADEVEGLDELIASSSEHWTLDRMPRTDLAILRVGAWELEHETAPASVVVSEAVHLANELSTDRSGAFINGVLGRIAAQRA